MNLGKITLRFKQIDSFFFTITESLTKFSKKGKVTVENPFVECNVKETITEKDFYRMFLNIRNAFAKSVYENEETDTSITPVNIEYMATIMSKDMSYTIPAKSKNKVQTELAQELGKNPQSAYSAIHRLRRSGYLVKTEDNLIEPNPELQSLRRVTKAHLDKLGVFPVSYLLNVVVKNEE